MTTQQQEQRPNFPQKHWSKRYHWTRWLIASVILLIMIVGIIIWILTSRNTITAILPLVIFTVLGVLIALFQWLFPVSSSVSEHLSAHQHALQVPPIIVHVPTTQPLHEPTPLPDKTSYRGIVGLPPPTDPRTIQQREHVVKEVYTKLLQPDLTAIALTGIGGVGKSTLAALIYRYIEEQRKTTTSLFQAETIWLTIDPAVTFADLAGNLFEALGKPLLDLNNLAPQNQAVALFNALNTTDKPILVIVDQFENLLDWNTGHALTDRPGVGEWLDMLNSQQCNCRILLTSRPRPVGTREYPATYLQEYPIGGLEMSEGIALLRNQGVLGTEVELQNAVSHCAGHALSLTLLVTLIRDHRMDLSALFRNTELWTGDIAINLLDQIFMQKLNDAQRKLLLAFSVYREPVPFEATIAIISDVSTEQVRPALRTLLTQHLLEAAGEGRYQLHAIIRDYAQGHLNEGDGWSNEEVLRIAHAKAAGYYLQRATTTCPPREKRRKVSDIHDLVEAIWQFCQGCQWQEAYDLMEKEGIYDDFFLWGNNEILLELYQLLLTTNWSPRPSETAHIYHNLGWVYNDLGRLDQAQMYFEKALVLWQELGDREKECAILNSLGAVYRDLGQKEQGQKSLLKALDLSRELGNRREESRALTNLAIIYNDFGKKEQARAYCEQALAIYSDLVDLWGEGWAQNILGGIYADLGQTERARDYLTRSLQIRRQLGNRLGVGRTLNNLSRVYIMLGQSGQALKCCEEALSVARDIGDYMGEGKAYSNFSLIYVALGKGEQSRKYAELALHILREVRDRGKEGWTLYNRGQAYTLLAKKGDAFKSYKEALVIFQEIKDRWREGETLFEIGKFFYEKEHYDVTLSFFLLAVNIFIELHYPYLDEAQSWIEKVRNELGAEKFSALLASVEPQTQQVAEQALNAGVDDL